MPFLDRGPEHHPRMRPRMMAGGAIFVVTILSLAVAGHFSKGAGTIAEGGPRSPSTPVASVAHMSASARQGGILYFKATSKSVIPAKAGIQKLLTSLDSRVGGSDRLIIIRGYLKSLVLIN